MFVVLVDTMVPVCDAHGSSCLVRYDSSSCSCHVDVDGRIYCHFLGGDGAAVIGSGGRIGGRASVQLSDRCIVIVQIDVRALIFVSRSSFLLPKALFQILSLARIQRLSSAGRVGGVHCRWSVSPGWEGLLQVGMRRAVTAVDIYVAGRDARWFFCCVGIFSRSGHGLTRRDLRIMVDWIRI